jgi:putative peptidoglycan lipid II flippase
MVRDVATATLFGLAENGVMDAFVVAFRIPNIFRRLFGEGALSASALPILAAKKEVDPLSMWQLVSTLLGCVFLVMAALTLLAEIFCGLLWYWVDGMVEYQLVVGLSAVMLPYLLFIALAAVASAALHAVNHFGTPAFVPVLLNLIWIVAAVGIAPYWKDQPVAQAYLIASAVLLGGFLQFVVQLPVLKRFGMRWQWDWAASRETLLRIARQLIPMAVGLAILPINTLVDTVVAWIFSAPQAGIPIAWLGGKSVYPLQEGTVAAIYFAERLYQFPVGLLGVVIGVVAFPALSRHASGGDQQQFIHKMTQALRANLFLAIPATAGLILLAQPLTSLLFRHGAFTEIDTLRTSQMVGAYACGIWAYSTLPVLIRGFYASADSQTPFRLGITVVVLNGLVDLALIWPCGETGLAYASAAAAAVFALLLTRKAHLQWHLFSDAMTRGGNALWKNPLVITLLRSSVATGVMYAAGHFLLLQMLPSVAQSFTGDFLLVSILLVSCLGIYLLVSLLLGAREWRQHAS